MLATARLNEPAYLLAYSNKNLNVFITLP